MNPPRLRISAIAVGVVVDFGGPFEHAPAWAAAMAWVLVVPVAVLGSAFVAPERVAPAAAAA
jgi:hypothetical protein